MFAAIVDDLKQERDLLKSYLEKYCQENNLFIQLSIFSSGEELLKDYTEKYDLIFLDIYMSGLTGLETAKKIRERDKNCLLIFSTTSPDFAIKSFRVRAFDYLLKPYNFTQFTEVMLLAEKSLKISTRFIEVKESREMVKIFLRDIIYVDYSNHYVQIHTKERLIKTYMYFADFALLVAKYPQFLHCYRNCLVNMEYITALQDNDFALSTGESLPINRTKKVEIKQLYANYAFKKLNGDV
ncbi:MAG TPA: response regulator transcription factor [Candidatus Avacidaminococcus intestinavium]|uniref:Response regulator transcription factor n=1 Tax=Candidatus Avacidaminococcus intestinavium TaxID=2840684 RepID=A0A9D1MQ69_9FIRM|nr:response regulator transcription factor [Candidatus Avacidaminococcus intestinavium]